MSHLRPIVPSGDAAPAPVASDRGGALQPYASLAVPRYTSYPTAPHFHKNISGVDRAQWLGALPPDQPISLYLHVPYCQQVCWYCGCHMKLAARYEVVSAYVEALIREIELVAEALPTRMRVAHLHWGGGTPTVLSPDDLTRVMERVGELFSHAPGAEIAIESDPRRLSQAMIDTIGALGFTRASFGVQEFDPAVQAAINRVQPPELVAECVTALRAAGVRGVNFDLIYGLPLQTVETLERTIARCAEMTPDRIALFGYAHVPWVAARQRMIKTEDLPGPAERIRQFAAAEAALLAQGWTGIGIDHFAKPSDSLAVAAREGRLRRNFQGYTTDDAPALIGLGASAISQTPNGFAQNISDTSAWTREIMAGRLPTARGVALTDDDRLRARVISDIMCYGRVDFGAVGRLFGAEERWFSDALPKLEAMVRDGVILLSGETLHVTRAGQTLRRVVASAFDAYLGASEARHSAAV